VEQLRLETGVISSVDREMYESLNQSGKVPSERRVSGFNSRHQRLKSSFGGIFFLYISLLITSELLIFKLSG
jgi:hypothetical protein